MICLDTNYLIRGLVKDSSEGSQLVEWVEASELLVAAAPCWYEFLCGPITEAHRVTMRAFLSKIVPFEERQAAEAARLFNAAGRPRRLRGYAMIAGTAIAAGAKLATGNRGDFQAFLSAGLRLV